MLGLSADIKSGTSGKLLFSGGVIKYAKDWKDSKLPVLLVYKAERKTRWADATKLAVVDGVTPLRGEALTAAAVGSWKDLAQSIEHAFARMRVSLPLLPAFEWVTPDKRYDVFLSFRGNEPFSPDSKEGGPPEGTLRERVVRPLAKKLRTSYSVFFDESSLAEALSARPGTTINDILQALLSTRGGGVVAVLLSRTYLQREWPLVELAAAAQLHDAGMVRLLVLILDGSVSDVCSHELLAHLCPRLKDVPMQTLTAPRGDPAAVRGAVEKAIKDCVGPLTPIGGSLNESFNDLLIRTANGFKRSEDDQGTLATALNIQRNRNEAMVDWLRASLTPDNVAPLLAALERYFAHPHSDLIQLVRAYEHKWHGEWASASPPDLATVHADVKAWLADRRVPH